MTEPTYDDVDDVLPNAPNGEIVHWMEPKPLSFGPGGVSAAVAGAFVIGVAATVAVLALTHWLGPQREAPIPRRRKETRRIPPGVLAH